AAFFNAPGGSPQISGSAPTPVQGTTHDGVFEVTVPVPAFAAQGDWQLVQVRLVDVAGNAIYVQTAELAAAGYPTTFTNSDLTAPQTTITNGPTGTVTTSNAEFSFSANEPGATFECRLDTGDWSTCSSPKTLTGLADGEHTFAVR